MLPIEFSQKNLSTASQSVKMRLLGPRKEGGQKGGKKAKLGMGSKKERKIIKHCG